MPLKKSPVVFPCFVLLFLLNAIYVLSGQEAGIPKPGDFAGSLVLTGTPGGLLGLEIPEAVYQGLERPDMGDIRVFDEAGNAVPFAIRRTPGITVTPPPEEVPFFRWDQDNDAVLPGSTDIVINAEGAVLNIKSRGLRPSAAPAYLLDLSGLSHAPSSLNITLGEEGELYNTLVRIYSSPDLSQWQEFERPQTLAWFGEGAGRELLELPRRNSRYLLLKFDKPLIDRQMIDRQTPEGADSSQGLSPRRISAVFDSFEIPPITREKTIAGEWRGDGRRIVDYRVGGFYPLTAIDFPLPQADAVEVRVKNKVFEQEEWSFAARTNLFRISAGTGEIRTNEALVINSSAPFWELEAAGDVAFSSLPGCTIRWAVYELVFLGRGTGPWTLAWGNGDHGPQVEGDLKLPETSGAPEIETARLLKEPVYQPRPQAVTRRPGRDWGQFVLWAILILAVIFLSGLALYIARAMKKERI
jgi:hypothetical protein